MNKEHIITILNEIRSGPAASKTMVRPSKRPEDLGRRRLNNPGITFYDLAQINTGSVEAPVWADHPILYTPAYTVAAYFPPGSGGYGGALYTIDPFLESNYLAFTASLFAIGPVTEWKNLFRKLEFELNPLYPDSGGVATPADYPTNLLYRYPPQDILYILTRNVFEYAADLGTPAGQLDRNYFLDLYNACWDNKGLEYKDFTEWTMRGNSSNGLEWFSGSTGRKDTYKVTSVNDSSAADVGNLTITGQIEVYLVPHVGMYIGASVGGAHTIYPYNGQDGVDVIGPWYQVMPRKNWPDFIDPYQLVGHTALDAAFLDYQGGRSGAQASHWVKGTGDTVTSGTMAPTAFSDGHNTYKATIDNRAFVGLYAADGTAVTFRQSSAGSNHFMFCTVPFLMAVMKIHGQFYYVWCLPGDEFGNTASFESSITTGYETLRYNPVIDHAP